MSGVESVVRPLRFEGDDEALVGALKSRHPGAMEALYDRYAHHVQRGLARVIGVDPELPELLQDVFVQAFSSVDSIRDGGRLKAWLTSIAVFTARGLIRGRVRKRWLKYRVPEKVPEVPVQAVDSEAREALRQTYEILDRLAVDDRIAFSLRFMEGMDLTEVADACRVSLATIKRRLRRAQNEFVPRARESDVLSMWIKRGDRWRTK